MCRSSFCSTSCTHLAWMVAMCCIVGKGYEFLSYMFKVVMYGRHCQGRNLLPKMCFVQTHEMAYCG
jgi:hypothetical protein